MNAATMPRVLAQPGTFPCGDKHASAKGVRCARPYGHDGGHLSAVPEVYWQAEEPQAVSS